MWAHPPLGPNGERVMRLAWGPWCRAVHLPVQLRDDRRHGARISLVELFAQSKLYRAQTAMLLVAVLLPSVVNVLFTAGFGDARFGSTPVAFALSGALLAWGFVRLRLFQLSPIAYRSIFDHMRDGVVVVDRYRRVVDVNQVALSLAGRTRARRDRIPGRGGRCPGATRSPPRSRRPRRGRALAAPADGRTLELVGLVDRAQRRAQRRATSCCSATSPSASARRRRCARARPGCGAWSSIRRAASCTCARSAAPPATCATSSACSRTPRPPRSSASRPTGLVGPARSRTPCTPTRRRSSRPSARRRAAARPATSSVKILRGGRESWFRFIASPVGGDLLVTFFDVTDRRAREREMQVALSQDPLTGLLNRRGLEADAPAVLGAAARRRLAACSTSTSTA